MCFLYVALCVYTFVYLDSGGVRMAKKRQTPLSHCYPVARRHKIYIYIYKVPIYAWAG